MADSGTDDATDDEPQADQYECDQCGDTFDSPNGLNAHKGHCDGGEGPDDETTADRDGFKLICRADVLQEFINRVSTVVDECKVRLTEDGMSTRAVDPANVAMADIFVAPRAFEHYELPRDDVIGINVGRFDEVVSPAGGDTTVTIAQDPQTRTLSIEWGGHSWTMALIDPDSIRQEPDLPNLDLPTTVDVPGRLLKRAVDFSDMVSDHMRIETAIGEYDRQGRDASLVFHAEGDTDDYTGVKPDGDDGVFFREQPDETVHSLYSLDYLKDIVAVFGKDETVAVVHGEDFPVKFKGEVSVPSDDDERKVGKSTYMLAPRIQSD